MAGLDPRRHCRADGSRTKQLGRDRRSYPLLRREIHAAAKRSREARRVPEDRVVETARVYRNRGMGEFARRQNSARGRCERDRKSTRLNSSHLVISYAVFCLKKKKKKKAQHIEKT